MRWLGATLFGWVVVLVFGGVAFAGPSTLVTQTSVSDVVLGSPLDIAYDVFGARPLRTRVGGMTRLVFPQPRAGGAHGDAVEVYVDLGTTRISAVVVSDPRWRTAEGIGPCSTVERLRAVYDRQLRGTRVGGLIGYRVGSLFFATANGAVRSVALSRDGDNPPRAVGARCDP